MKELATQEFKNLQVEILMIVDQFCREKGIQYTVDGGTCIGAVRHKGYIPWDDDIDIAMTRPNYERFIHSFNGYHNHLEVFAPELNWNYYAPYANVCDNRTFLDEGKNGHNGMEIGVKIDVFPIDGVANDIKRYHKDKKRLALLWNILYIKRVSTNRSYHQTIGNYLLFLVKRALLAPFSYSSIQKVIKRLASKYPFEKATYVEDRIYPQKHDIRCSRKAFEEYDEFPFENIKVSILKGYDEYLTKIYGDYLTLPPADKRTAHHGFKSYWKY